jgi:HemK-related putative methylase
VRRAEGRGSDDASYYRALPFEDLSGQMTEDWRIRARSFRALLERVVQPMETRIARPMRILDVGAGNGWLANRLAGRGHLLAAVDLRVDARDGLGVYCHYDAEFTPVQAEYDRLPFASGQCDLVIFNASIHYSTDYVVTLREALRVLNENGRLAIIDTPVYRDAHSGEAMVREREAGFEQRYGFSSNALPSENFLTFERLDRLGAELGVEWRMHEPFYGLKWTLKPLRAKVRRQREPASFLVIAGRRAALEARPPGRLQRASARQALRWRYRLTQRHRYNRLVLEEVAGRPLLVLPQVFNPKLFRTGAYLAGLLDERLIPAGSEVLDMGCGSGVAGVMAATWAGRVVAVDINPDAVRCARINALLNRLDDKIEVREGDLFGPVPRERFDVVLFNPPYYRGAPRDAAEHAWRSDDTVERFAEQLGDHLVPGGCALVVLSTDGDAAGFLEAFRASGFDIAVVARRKLLNETLTVYRLSVKG